MREMKNSGIEWIGEIPKDWEIRKIKHSFTIFSGTTPKSDNLNYWDGDIPWITPADYKTKDKYVFHGKKFLTKLAVDEYKLKLIPKNSIVFSKRAPIGEVIITGSELATNQGCLSCIINKQYDVKYFYFTISVFSEQFNLLGSGTTFKEISSNDFENFVLPFPQLNIQHRIAEYLDKKCSKIDEIISKQQIIIEKLKEYKLSIITEAVTKGLNPNVTMKDSGVEWIGEIPEHWEVVKIKIGVTKVGSGKTPSGGAEIYSDTGVLFLRSQNVYDTGIVLDNPTYITSEIDEEMKNTRVLPNDVLLNITGGSIGRCAIFPKELNNANVNQHVSIIRTKKDIFTSEYMHYYWISDLGQTAIKLYQTGGNREGMSADAIKNAPIALLPIQEQKQITDYLDSKCEKIDFTINKKQKLIDKLTEYKKSLIYEVVTGKKEV